VELIGIIEKTSLEKAFPEWMKRLERCITAKDEKPGKAK
jgi:hypothetical protein